MTTTPPIRFEQLPCEVSQALLNVLHYLWEDEGVNYFATSPDEKAEHIFESLVILAIWMTGGSLRLPPLN